MKKKASELFEGENSSLRKTYNNAVKKQKMVKDDTQKYLEDGIKRGKTLNHYKMLEMINNLVQTDFVFDMECKFLPKSKPYTQSEAREMADLLGTIYSIAHCIHCNACQIKYLLKSNLPLK